MNIEPGMASTSGHSSITGPENISIGSNERKRKRPAENTSLKIEAITGHQVSNGTVSMYQVKWVGLDAVETTWEPAENLDCFDLVAEYFSQQNINNIRKSSLNNRIFSFKKKLSFYTKHELLDLAKSNFTNEGHILPDVETHNIDRMIMLLLKMPSYARDARYVDKIRKPIIELKLRKRREKQLRDLKKWEEHINILCTDPALIKVYNTVDLDGPPRNFSYINTYIVAPNVNYIKDEPKGCDCRQLCLTSECCSQHDTKSAYTKDRLLKVNKGIPIYECNLSCLCPSNCENRVVQKGRTIPIAIFKTHDGRGWGLKALEQIIKGAFVCEYVGEVISRREADKRAAMNGATYFYDLDFEDSENFPFTVDATVYGNIGRFVNHSCRPNLALFAVYVDCLDPNLPRLAFFATRTIKENEELFIEYIPQPHYKKIEKAPMFPTCKCGARNCRKYIC